MHCMQECNWHRATFSHVYAVGVADKAAREGLPPNVLHSSSVYWLHGCSAGAWWSAYWCLYHLFQRLQRCCNCCFLVVDGHFSFRAQLLLFRRLGARLQDSIFYLWLLPYLVGCLLVAVTFFTNGLSALFFFNHLVDRTNLVFTAGRQQWSGVSSKRMVRKCF